MVKHEKEGLLQTGINRVHPHLSELSGSTHSSANHFVRKVNQKANILWLHWMSHFWKRVKHSNPSGWVNSSRVMKRAKSSLSLHTKPPGTFAYETRAASSSLFNLPSIHETWKLLIQQWGLKRLPFSLSLALVKCYSKLTLCSSGDSNSFEEPNSLRHSMPLPYLFLNKRKEWEPRIDDSGRRGLNCLGASIKVMI